MIVVDLKLKPIRRLSLAELRPQDAFVRLNLNLMTNKRKRPAKCNACWGILNRWLDYAITSDFDRNPARIPVLRHLDTRRADHA